MKFQYIAAFLCILTIKTLLPMNDTSSTVSSSSSASSSDAKNSCTDTSMEAKYNDQRPCEYAESAYVHQERKKRYFRFAPKAAHERTPITSWRCDYFAEYKPACDYDIINDFLNFKALALHSSKYEADSQQWSYDERAMFDWAYTLFESEKALLKKPIISWKEKEIRFLANCLSRLNCEHLAVRQIPLSAQSENEQSNSSSSATVDALKEFLQVFEGIQLQLRAVYEFNMHDKRTAQQSTANKKALVMREACKVLYALHKLQPFEEGIAAEQLSLQELTHDRRQVENDNTVNNRLGRLITMIMFAQCGMEPIHFKYQVAYYHSIERCLEADSIQPLFDLVKLLSQEQWS